MQGVQYQRMLVLNEIWCCKVLSIENVYTTTSKRIRFIRECLVYGDIYTSFNIRKYEIQTHVTTQDPDCVVMYITAAAIDMWFIFQPKG